jgi:TonB family protein
VILVALALALGFIPQFAAQCSPSSPEAWREPCGRVSPVYPPAAKAAKVQGTVVLKVKIGKAGDVQRVKLVSGHPLLVSAAIDAVKRWKFKPYLSNGFPVKVETIVRVNFTLDQGAAANIR